MSSAAGTIDKLEGKVNDGAELDDVFVSDDKLPGFQQQTGSTERLGDLPAVCPREEVPAGIDKKPGDGRDSDGSHGTSDAEEAAETCEYVAGQKGDPFRAYRIGKQTILVLVWVCIGLYAEIVGPTLPDLKDRLGVNYEEVSKSLVGKSIGLMVGAVIGGFLHERFYRQTDLIIAISLVLAAVATLVTPFSNSLGLLGAMFALNGFAEGLINTGGNTMVMHMWGEAAAAPMHSLHFGFGLGALVAPQIARPFLSDEAAAGEEDDAAATTAGPSTPPITALANLTAAPAGGESRIQIPYAIIATAITVFAIVVFIYYLVGPPKGFVVHRPNRDFKKMINPASCGKGFFFYGLELFIVLFFYFMQAVGAERALGKFLFSFAIECDLAMSKSTAANLQTAFWASFTFGRLGGIAVARWVPMPVMITGDVIGLVIASSVLAAYANSVELVLWIVSCVVGIFIGTAFPNGMSWANLYLDMNSMGVMVLMIGGSCGAFIYQYLTGYLFERDPRNLMYVMVGCSCVLGLVFAIMQALGTLHGRRINAHMHSQEEKQQMEVTSEETRF